MKTTRFKLWLCSRCGYAMDAASPAFNNNSVPKQGDLSICLNCGEAHTLDGEAWRRLTATEVAGLDPAERRELTRAQTAQAAGGLPDLSKRGGRA